MLSATVSEPLGQTGTLAPLGLKVSRRSFRSGAISAAYAESVPLPIIMRLSNQTALRMVQNIYLDRQTLATPEVLLLFGRFLGVERVQGTGG